MKQILALMIALPLLFISCKKEDKCPYTDSPASAPASERAYLQSYLTNNSITAIEHSSGFFYNISVAGSGGSSPAICSTVKARYTGSFIPGGGVFDATPAGSTGVNFTLGRVIVGWQKALSLLKAGGKITLYIPPSLAYGSQDKTDGQGNVVIPANSYMKFEVELVNVQ